MEESPKNLMLGNFLKILRKEHGYTLREVEAKTGISNTYISNLENGKKTTPSMETLFKLSKIYNEKRPLAFIEMLEYSGMVSKKDILTMKGALLEDRNKNLLDKGYIEQSKLGEKILINHSVSDKYAYDLHRILNQINKDVYYNKTSLEENELNLINEIIQAIIKNRK